MALKPQDILILLKLVVLKGSVWTYSSLAQDIAISPSEVHAGIKRAALAHLIRPDGIRPIIQSLEEFLIHGVKYAFPPERGGLTRGMPTGYAAFPLNQKFIQSEDPPPVWPDLDGQVRGYKFSPLYKSVPVAAKKDARLYELTAIVDSIRDGRAREREAAVHELKNRLYQ